MKTWKRICVEDYTLRAKNGDTLELKRGEEYVTSGIRADGKVVVFTNFWVPVPVTLFAGERQFT